MAFPTWWLNGCGISDDRKGGVMLPKTGSEHLQKQPSPGLSLCVLFPVPLGGEDENCCQKYIYALWFNMLILSYTSLNFHLDSSMYFLNLLSS